MTNNVATAKSEDSLVFSITCSTGNSLFAFSTSKVKEIISIPALSGTSGTHDCPYFKGMFDLRGTIVPVVDLSLRLFNHPCTSKTAIVMEFSGQHVAFMVDDVSSVESLTLEPYSVPSVPALIALSKQPNNLIQFLDPEILVKDMTVSMIMTDLIEGALV